MATNRIETLDPALIRPGRIDRKIEFPLPDEKTKRRIFNIHTARMTLAPDVQLDELVMSKDDLSGADIKVSYCCCVKSSVASSVETHVLYFNLPHALTIYYYYFTGNLHRRRTDGSSRTPNESHQ